MSADKIDLAALAKPMAGKSPSPTPEPPTQQDPPTMPTATTPAAAPPATRTDRSWEARHQRATFHADKDQLRLLRRHAKARGESLSAVINRAITELLSRET